MVGNHNLTCFSGQNSLGLVTLQAGLLLWRRAYGDMQQGFRFKHVLTQVAYVPDGLEAIIFTADGDMRQALNNLQVPLQAARHALQSRPPAQARLNGVSMLNLM